MDQNILNPGAVTHLNVKRVPLDSLHLDPSNAREHGPENLDAFVGSLKRFAQAEPLVVQKKSGRVIGGNGRLVAMKRIGWTECGIVELDIDDLTATAHGIALNRTSDLAVWNDETIPSSSANAGAAGPSSSRRAAATIPASASAVASP